MKLMRSAKSTSLSIGAVIVAGAGILGVTHGIRSSHRRPAARQTADLQAALERAPLSFEPNQGQASSGVQYMARGNRYGLFLSPTEASMVMGSGSAAKGKKSQTWTRLQMRLVGSNPNAGAAVSDKLRGTSNYFVGNDHSKWRTKVPNYGKVRFQGVYPGVDLAYYGRQGHLEYDFIVKPGADPSQVRLSFSGANQVRVTSEGDLELATASGVVRHHRPEVYQENGRRRSSVAGRYVQLASNEIGFHVDSYDRSRTLVIDPVLDYSRYLGGSARDLARGIVSDANGNVYVTGLTASNPFAGTGGYKGGTDAYVTKFAPDGGISYNTYIGGSANENTYLDASSNEVLCGAVAIDSAGEAFVTGYTESTDFPLVAPIQVRNAGNGDAFVVKLSADGTRMIYSTYLGGRGQDAGRGIAVANLSDGPNAYITGVTASPDFNVVNASQPQLAGGTDAFVTRINGAGTGMVYSTYLGGTKDELGYAITVDPTEHAVYVTGQTLSTDFPTTSNAYDSTGLGSSDVFLTRFSASDSTLQYSTYFGGSGENTGTAVAVDALGDAYITGFTSSTDLPTRHPLVIQYTVNGVQVVYDGSKYGGHNNANGGLTDGFVAKLDVHQAGDNSLIYSTYLGGTGDDVATGIAVNPVTSDPTSNRYAAYVTGFTTSSDFPVVNALRTSPVGGQDAFVAKIQAEGSSLEYSSYLGGSLNDVATGIAIDGSSRAYICGTTASNDFPVIRAGGSSFSGGTSDAFVTRLIAPPAPPTALAGTVVSSTEIDLTWTDNSDNEGSGNANGTPGFIVERKDPGAAFVPIASLGANVTAYNDTTLTEFTSYSYRVRSVNSVGTSAFSNVVTRTTPPTTPTAPDNLVATAVSQSSIALTWNDNSSNETGFEIQRSQGNDLSFALIATTAANTSSFTDTGLNLFTTYYYRVRATNVPNGGSVSAYTNEANATTFDNPPAAPTGLSASAVTKSSSQVLLTWTDQSNNETSFEVQYSTNGVTWTSITGVPANNIAAPSPVSYTVTGLSGGTTYTFQVRAVNSGGPSGFSNQASANTKPNPPLAPGNLTALTQSSTSILLNWVPGDTAEDHFDIYRSTDATTFNLDATVGKGFTTFLDTALTPNTTYFYYVVAGNDGGDSAHSNTANATTAPNPPVRPSSISLQVLSKSSIQVNWVDNASDQSGYIVQRSQNNVNFTGVATIGSANTLTFTDTGLSADTLYFYRVLATNSGGASLPSDVASARTFKVAPGAPSGLNAAVLITASPYQFQVNLTWTDNSSNEDGFVVSRSTDGVTFSPIATTGAGATSYTDNTAAVDSTYYYEVHAFNNGGSSAEAGPALVNTPPAAPSGLALSGITNSRIHVFWIDNSSTHPVFVLERQDGAVGAFKVIANIPANTTSYDDTGLKGGTTYTYRVKAVDASGLLYSDYATAVSGTTLPDPPTAPSSLSATAVGKTEIDLAWTNTAGVNVTSFKIERSTDGTNFSQVHVNTGSTSVTYNDTGLAVATTYYYRVRASNLGGDSGYSNVASDTTFPLAPIGPSGLTATVVDSASIRLAWKDNSSNEDSFIVERSTDAVTFGLIATLPANAISYVDTGLNSNKTYYYRVKASNKGGDSGYTSVASALTFPNAPTGLTATAVGATVQLQWSQVGGADGFKVYYRTGNGSFNPPTTVSAGTTQFTQTGLLPGRTFTFQVTAFNRAGESAPSNQVSATTGSPISSLALSKTKIKGGKSVTATVTLSGPAPAGGAVVSLGSDSGSAIAPASITIAAGQTSGTATITTKKVKKTTAANITAAYAGVSRTVSLTITK